MSEVRDVEAGGPPQNTPAPQAREERGSSSNNTKSKGESDSWNPLKADDDNSSNSADTGGSILAVVGCVLLLVLLAGILMSLNKHFPFEHFTVSRLGTFFWVLSLMILILICVVSSQASPSSPNRKFVFRRLNDKYTQYRSALTDAISNYNNPLPKSVQKLLKTHRKKQENSKTSKSTETQMEQRLLENVRRDLEHGVEPTEIENRLRPKAFVIYFRSDTTVSNIGELRKQISIVCNVATKYDTVVVVLTSFGGLVHSYALAAAQLGRIRSAGVPLTVCIDTAAASGGYMMACVANKIVAAPGAFVGSIGVVSYRPNFQKLLNKAEIDVYLLTAGKYKRTVDVVGEVTPESLEKAKEELVSIHESFKQHVALYRPQLNMDVVATGEAWMAQESVTKGLNLVDQLLTSDEYIENLCHTHHVIKIKRMKEKGWASVLKNIPSSVASRISAIWKNPVTEVFEQTGKIHYM